MTSLELLVIGLAMLATGVGTAVWRLRGSLLAAGAQRFETARREHGALLPAVILWNGLGLAASAYSQVTQVTAASIDLHYQNLNLFRAPYTLYLGNSSDGAVRDIGYAVTEAGSGRVVAAGVFDGLSAGQVRELPVAYPGGPPPPRLELCLVHDGPWWFQRTALLLPIERPGPDAGHYAAAGMVRTESRYLAPGFGCDQAMRGS